MWMIRYTALILNFNITLLLYSDCKVVSVSSDSFSWSFSESAFFDSASRSLLATSIFACLALICAVHGWSSFCFSWILSWNTCVLSEEKKSDMAMNTGRHTNLSDCPGFPRALSLLALAIPPSLRASSSHCWSSRCCLGSYWRHFCVLQYPIIWVNAMEDVDNNKNAITSAMDFLSFFNLPLVCFLFSCKPISCLSNWDKSFAARAATAWTSYNRNG